MSYRDPLLEANLALVEEHIRSEDRRDLEGLMATLTENCVYRDFALRNPIRGRDGAAQYYRDLWRLAPDFRFRVVHRIASRDAVALEVVGYGTHLGDAFGLPPTGRRFVLPMIWLFPVKGGRLGGERVYFDGSEALRQLGFLPPRNTPVERLLLQAARRPGLWAGVAGALGVAALVRSRRGRR